MKNFFEKQCHSSDSLFVVVWKIQNTSYVRQTDLWWAPVIFKSITIFFKVSVLISNIVKFDGCIPHKKLLWSPRLFLRVQWLPETRKSANCSTNGLPYKWQVPVHTRAMNEQIGFSCFSDLEAMAGTGGRDTY